MEDTENTNSWTARAAEINFDIQRKKTVGEGRGWGYPDAIYDIFPLTSTVLLA